MSKSRKLDRSRFQGQQPISKDDFARLMLDRIQQAGERGRIVYQPEHFRLHHEVNNVNMSLGNVYAEYGAAAGRSRERIVKHWVRVWFSLSRELPEEFEDAKPDLLPLVKSRSDFELAGPDLGSGVISPYEVLGEHFGVGIVYDQPESMCEIAQVKLDAWGITFHDGLTVATENLQTLPARFIESQPGVYLSRTGDNYDACRLLLTDAIRQLPVQGDRIAMIPNRDNLIIAGSDDVASLTRMAELAIETLRDPRQISTIALRLDGEVWTQWLPPSSHPAYKQFRQLYLRSVSQDYAQQQRVLERMHARNGQDIFVATFSTLQTPKGNVFSYSAWTTHENSMLPKTDKVALLRRGEDPLSVEWQKMVDVLGDRMVPLDIYPPRYHVRTSPPEEQLAELAEHGQPPEQWRNA